MVSLDTKDRLALIVGIKNRYEQEGRQAALSCEVTTARAREDAAFTLVRE